ncbi:hypothetical protein FNV43_RR11124 [Rhamnella rubrinervis]|uniref:Uncharacterized protein n=1 Tax=Rhamnella rubrinervis TaxID=2594499 RepID=A0A8K0H541_9ROSA|nr:hypothetical protein FNV43_RR11124 [Rhamnella rubrinervis]
MRGRSLSQWVASLKGQAVEVITDLAIEGRLVEKSQAVPPRLKPEGLDALIFSAKSAFDPNLRPSLTKMAWKRLCWVLPYPYAGCLPCLGDCLRSEELERRTVETIQELSAELDDMKKEGNDNVMLGYSIMRRVVARKFSGSQDTSWAGDHPVNELVVDPFDVRPSAEAQEAGKVTEKVVKTAEVKVAEGEEKI